MTKRRVIALLTFATLSTTSAILGLASVDAPAATTAAASSAGALRPAHSDFDGDGKDDLAIGALPSWTNIEDPAIDGAMVRYSSGLAPQLLAPAQDASAGGAPPVASGDFDGDGFDDLAMARPFDRVPVGVSLVEAGSVWIFYGGPGGFTSLGTRIHQGTPGIPGGSELSDWWGFALAAGDTNGDGNDDLAIGAPREGIGSVRTAGAVTVVLGSPSGLDTSSAKLFHQGTGAIPSAPERDDYFGVSLAIGDVTGDHKADLVVGSRENDFGGVTLLRGSSSGITTTGSDLLTAGQIAGTSQLFLNGIPVVGVGDTNGNGLAEVIVGWPISTVGARDDAGAVVSIVGRSSGLSASGARILHQNTPGVPEVAETGDHFGASIAAGDVTGDGRADVVVGVPEENKYDRVNVGAFTLLKGSSVGLTGVGSQYFDQNTTGVPGTAETNDRFGDVVSLLDLNGDGKRDAAVGDRWEDSGRGTVTLFRGSSTGLTPTELITAVSLSTPEIQLFDFGGSIVQ
jgi:hypothetical protein